MENTINQIGGHLSNGLSVFYLINDNCAHSFGYLPSNKSLLPEDLKLADELHRERLFAGEWLVQDGEKIKNRIVPQIIELCGHFSDCRDALEQGKVIQDNELINVLGRLEQVLSDIDREDEHLKDWFKRILAFYNEIPNKFQNKIQSNPESGAYSWQDAAQKLNTVLQAGDKMTVVWKSISLLVEDTVNDLRQSGKSSSEIIRAMFCGAAAQQWQDVVKISEDIVRMEWQLIGAI